MSRRVLACRRHLFTECRFSNTWLVQEGRSQHEAKTEVKNSSGVSISFIEGRSRGTYWRIMALPEA